MIVIYSGRFQPFHIGHYNAYKCLCNKFGKNNVYIITSNKTQLKSPFNFKQKALIITTMFGVDSKHIIQQSNPYKPSFLNNMPDDTQAIFCVGQKDQQRLLHGKYFLQYKPNINMNGYKENGYIYTISSTTTPKIAGIPISGSVVRQIFGNPQTYQSIKENLFKQLYGKLNKNIFKLFIEKIKK